MCGILCIISYGIDIDLQNAINKLNRLKQRGPDSIGYKYYNVGGIYIFMGFTRLAIMDTSDKGMQPFENADNVMICNGEIYNYKELKEEYNLTTESESDCEVPIKLLDKFSYEKMINLIDAEYAMIVLNKIKKTVYFSRDDYGVRPLFIGKNEMSIYLASEMKVIHDSCKTITPVKPRRIFSLDLLNNNLWRLNKKINVTNNFLLLNIKSIESEIRNKLENAVKKRLHSDRPIGFLLSGGLDSSLIVSIATKILGPENIITFTIGFPNSPDVESSKIVAKFLGIEKNHHIVPFNVEIGLNSIRETIERIESYDITTVRASIPQFVMAKYISQKTNVKVILSGEGSDEIHGSYRYFRNAKHYHEFHDESVRLVKELYMFDNLRTDRTMSGCGLEVRIPFLDNDYVDLIINQIHPQFLMNNKNIIEKKILRDSFKGYLPDEILYRSKEAFSDAVSCDKFCWYKSIQLEAENIYCPYYYHNNPETPDGKLFRKIFEELYPNRSGVIKHLWLPRFQTSDIKDPSATVLECY